jgi:hypothetical protein
MAMDDLVSNLINNPLRSEIISRILNPSEKCPEYQKCSGFGTIPECELGPKDQKKFAESVQKLFKLSNTRRWYSLRDALRKLNGAGALKTCELLAAFIAIKGRITGEQVEKQAASYDSARDVGSAKVGEALKSVTSLEKSFEGAEERQPEVLQTKRFIEYKRALCNLVSCGLKALEELHEMEERASSKKVLKELSKTTFRLNIKEILHVSSAGSSTRYWAEIHDILDGVEEVVRRPRPADWSKTTPKRGERIAGSNLRQDINKLSSSDEATLKRWFSMLGPDLYARFEKEEDQIALLKEIMEREPNFPPMLEFLLPVAFLYRDDLMALKIVAERGGSNLHQ